MRDKYYSFLCNANISDVLIDVDISYSSKLEILKKLFSQYNVKTINRALELYKKNYIDINRIEEYLIFNQINYFCKKISREG